MMAIVEEGGHYYPRCGDCGSAIKESTKSSRKDVCDECWDNRGWLLENRVMIGTTEFQRAQKMMGGRRGTAKRHIEKLKLVEEK